MYLIWSFLVIVFVISILVVFKDIFGNFLVVYDYVYSLFGQIVDLIKWFGNVFDFGNGFVDVIIVLNLGLIFDVSKSL